ncbi:molybdopterin-containing oxidoreductase family protein [Cognatishimia activa]|uniref:molybdopterin-containing oxidoreductase family protein n=1 Tax=Cognatishimia activa TaxID=1715691 RepID=UPI00222FC755|nr:molybdopterin-dependent oxidoreductase [Cognatishimia activa]UZD90783.1 molybdopterin-dependent oxidoreductase [Cognatishimia activa]
MAKDLEILPSVCPLDCPDTCSLSVEVTDGEITKVRGSTANSYTGGVICNKVARTYAEFVHGPNRLTHPMKRVEDGFEPISWDEALELVYEGFTKAIQDYGSEAVMPLNYAGPHGELAAASMDMRFFYRLGATQLARKPLCGGVRGAAYSSLFGSTPGMPPAQAIHSDLVLVWGTNVTVANLHFTRVLKDVRRAGGKVVVIDPKRIKQAEQSDMFLQIKPGTDVVLGLALAAELQKRAALDEAFLKEWALGAEEYLAHANQYTISDAAEICGLELSDIETVLDWIVSAKNIATSVGVGLERSASGGAALRAAMSLNALTGHHGRLGAGVISKSGAFVSKTAETLQAEHLNPNTRVVNILDTARVILDRDAETPIGAVMVYNHNPVATHPDQRNMIAALSHPDVFTVGCDVALTDSMKLCDVILPACTHFEHDDIYGSYGHNHVQRAAPVIAPVGESLPNTEIFRRLAARFGFDEAEFRATDQELMDQAMTDLGVSPRDFPLDHSKFYGGEIGEEGILCATLAPSTPSGKIELFSADLENRFGAGLPQFQPAEKAMPLTLITPASDKRINATFGGCSPSEGVERLEMHPDDARARGLTDGEDVLLWNALGEVALTLQVTDAMQSGVVYVPKGAWLASSATGMTVNALISADSRCDLIDGAAYNDTYVDVRAI